MNPVSDDTYATLLLCSDLALNTDGEVRAYTISQWSDLCERLTRSRLTPGALFDRDIKTKLDLTEEEALRIEKLMSRAGRFGVELSALNDTGIFTLTKSDARYPESLKKKLKRLAPPVLYYAGNLSLLSKKSVAIVGSRNIDESGLIFTEELAKRCAAERLNIVSGGARGADTVAENIANNSGGTTVIFVADSLEKKIRQRETREAILRRQSIILSSFRPDMPFRAYAAMERNKYIYALSDFAVVVSADYNKGGTWSGAAENLKHGWTPLFVRTAELPPGNAHLLKNTNAYPIEPDVLNSENTDIFGWFASQLKPSVDIIHEQISFFD